MFEKIVLAVDGSDSAERAMSLAAGIARQSDGEIVVCHVTEADPELSRGGLDPGELPQAGMAIASHFVEELVAEGVKARSDMRVASHGRVAAEILKVAKDEDAGVIVLGTRGLSDLTAAFLGSVTHKVLHLSDIPVLIAP